MQKIKGSKIITTFAVFLTVVNLAAQTDDTPASDLTRNGLNLGGAVEISGYTAESLGFGIIFAADWRFPQESILNSWGAGFRAHYNNDFDGITAFGGSLLVRYYPLELKYGNILTSFFLQLEAGFDYMSIERNGREKNEKPFLMAAGGAGVRLSMMHFYIEPFIRGGYPFIAAGGVAFGYRF